jgi:antitoxin component of RelBE/YafQ-DinJ toxin-antitoxin module
MPFPVAIPNAQTVAAMKEAENPAALKRYRSFREVREGL